MEWFIRFESRADISDDAAEELLGHVVAVRLTDNPAGGRWCDVTIRVEAADHMEALRKAQRIYMRAVGVVSVESIEAPYRVTVEQADAPTGHDLVSTKGVAARLGVSDARVRKLAERPGFPQPLGIPGLAGDIYSSAAIDAWAATWDRANQGGRPRRDG